MEVVVGENVAADAADDTTNPFAPKIFKGGGTAKSDLNPTGRERTMELIRLENITKTYHLGEVDVPVLKGISLTIAAAKWWR